MRLRLAVPLIALLLAGCGQSKIPAAPSADMPARTWQYYVAHAAEIETMQKICLQWSGSNAPAATEPVVIATNCSAAAYAKAHLKWKN